MRRTLKTLLLMTAGALLAGSSLVALAGDPAPGERPERGLRMRQVEARYGAPAARHDAVGHPPITRWDYPSMVVYFEGDRVVHAVLEAPAPR
jgi:hypothetical protein